MPLNEKRKCSQLQPCKSEDHNPTRFPSNNPRSRSARGLQARSLRKLLAPCIGHKTTKQKAMPPGVTPLPPFFLSSRNLSVTKVSLLGIAGELFINQTDS